MSSKLGFSKLSLYNRQKPIKYKIKVQLSLLLVKLIVNIASVYHTGHFYQELGLESLKRRRWYRKLCLFYMNFKENKPVYLFNLIPTKRSNYNTRNTDTITLFHTKHNFFTNYIFPSTVNE